MENLTTNNLSKQEAIKNSNDEDRILTHEEANNMVEQIIFIQRVSEAFEKEFIDLNAIATDSKYLRSFYDSVLLIKQLTLNLEKKVRTFLER